MNTETDQPQPASKWSIYGGGKTAGTPDLIYLARADSGPILPEHHQQLRALLDAEPALDEITAELAAYRRAPHPDDAYMRGRAEARKEADEEWAPLIAERDDLRQRISNARTEIRRQSILVHGGPATFVNDALAEVETHLVDPEYRPGAKVGA